MGRLNHRRGRPSNYRKSLKDNPYWEKVKRKVKIRDKFQCIICAAKIRLEVHHILYKINGTKIFGKELEFLEWLCCLCETCHQHVHKTPKHPLNPNNPNKKSLNDFK